MAWDGSKAAKRAVPHMAPWEGDNVNKLLTRLGVMYGVPWQREEDPPWTCRDGQMTKGYFRNPELDKPPI